MSSKLLHDVGMWYNRYSITIHFSQLATSNVVSNDMTVQILAHAVRVQHVKVSHSQYLCAWLSLR